MLKSVDIAFKDPTFKSLFGSIFNPKGGWLIVDEKDYGLAELCKDMLVQASIDWAFSNGKEYTKEKYKFIVESARQWINGDDIFNNSNGLLVDNKSLKLLMKYPITFAACCDACGLDIEKARMVIEYIRQHNTEFKLPHGRGR